jgi:hypothetical protein
MLADGRFQFRVHLLFDRKVFDDALDHKLARREIAKRSGFDEAIGPSLS